MAYLILGIGVLIGGILLVRWFANAQPQQIVSGAKWVALALGAAVIIFMLLLRRFDVIGWLFAVALPFMLRFSSLFRHLKTMRRAAAGPSPGQFSEIRTHYFIMRLEHDSGQLSGDIIAGPYQGRTLQSLTLEEALALLAQCRQNDPNGAQALETFIDRVHGPDWRANTASGTGQGTGGENASRQGHPRQTDDVMTPQRAAEILGVSVNASAQEIRSAHRRLMKIAHPDQGGSDFLATQINRAKDSLLGR
jgi:hypothetical protein